MPDPRARRCTRPGGRRTSRVTPCPLRLGRAVRRAGTVEKDWRASIAAYVARGRRGRPTTRRPPRHRDDAQPVAVALPDRNVGRRPVEAVHRDVPIGMVSNATGQIEAVLRRRAVCQVGRARACRSLRRRFARRRRGQAGSGGLRACARVLGLAGSGRLHRRLGHDRRGGARAAGLHPILVVPDDHDGDDPWDLGDRVDGHERTAVLEGAPAGRRSPGSQRLRSVGHMAARRPPRRVRHAGAGWPSRARSPTARPICCASVGPGPVLDAGCGMGRVAMELARRGFDVMGVDLDADMVGVRGGKGPDLPWLAGDLATVQLGRRFRIVALRGQHHGLRAPGRPAGTVVTNLAGHLGRRRTAGGRVRGRSRAGRCRDRRVRRPVRLERAGPGRPLGHVGPAALRRG